MAISPSTIGNFKFIVTTKEDLSSSDFWQAGIPSGSGKIVFGDIRVFELPSGSEIESDFTNLTADQLAIKYPYIKGDSVKSVPASLKVKTVAKNLFDGKKIKYYGNGQGYVKFNEDEQKIEILRLDGGAFEGFTFDFEAQIGQIYTLSFNMISNPTGFSIAIIDPDSNVSLYSTGFFYNIGSKTLTFVATKRKLTIKSYNGMYNNSPAIIQYLQLQAGSVVTGYKEYKETVQYISAKDSNGKIIELRGLPNGISDTIKNGKLIKRVSDEYILNGNEVWVYNPVYNYFYTENINPKNINMLGAIAYSPDIQYVEKLSSSPLATAFTIGGSDYAFFIRVEGITNTNSLINYLKNNPVKIIYQLAIPQEIPVLVDGTLQAFEDGSIYIEPYLKEEFVVTGTIINLPKPISAIDKIEILQNNVWTEATGTLSSDGKTITVNSSGKYRVFGSIKAEESLIPEVTYTVPVNLKAQVDSNTKAITAINKRMIDLNDKVDILSEYLGDYCAEFDSHKADLVTDSDGVHGLKIEQGIWTPYFFGNTTPGTPTYTVQNGYYYKINRLVFISGSITISAVGGMTGTLLLGGLPFAVSGNQAIGGISIGYKNTVNNYHFGFMPNTSRLQGYNGIDVVDSSEIPSNLSIQFTGVYLTN